MLLLLFEVENTRVEIDDVEICDADLLVDVLHRAQVHQDVALRLLRCYDDLFPRRERLSMLPVRAGKLRRFSLSFRSTRDKSGGNRPVVSSKRKFFPL